MNVLPILQLYHLRARLSNSFLAPNPKVFPKFGEIIAKAKEKVEAWNGQFYFVYLPEWSRFSRKDPNDGYFRYRNKILGLVRQQGIPIIDFYEVLSRHPDPLSIFPFRLEGHYNSEGYRMVAESILSRMERDKIGSAVSSWREMAGFVGHSVAHEAR